jgi:hypothetical protein
MATTKLQLYNNALLAVGELGLSSLTENRESRRVLDQVYDSGFLDTILELAPWKFATRSIQLTYDPGIVPDFGYSYACEKPSDFVVICKVCSDEYYNYPLLQYQDEGNYLFSDLTEIYIQYVSNDAALGYDLSRWPPSFSRYAELHLATKICERLTHSETKLKTLFALMSKALTAAKSKDAMKNPTTFLPAGDWTTSRGNRVGNGGRRDRGGRGSLY